MLPLNNPDEQCMSVVSVDTTQKEKNQVRCRDKEHCTQVQCRSSLDTVYQKLPKLVHIKTTAC